MQMDVKQSFWLPVIHIPIPYVAASYSKYFSEMHFAKLDFIATSLSLQIWHTQRIEKGGETVLCREFQA